MSRKAPSPFMIHFFLWIPSYITLITNVKVYCDFVVCTKLLSISNTMVTDKIIVNYSEKEVLS